MVEINGTAQTPTYNSGDNITISVDGDPGTPGLQPITGEVFIRIYDSSRDGFGLPTSSIGKVTIHGSADLNTNARLDVAVIWRDSGQSDPGFPGSFGDALVENIGSINFGCSSSATTCPTDPTGGLVILNPSDSGDTSLAQRTRLAMACTGEITGSMTVGQVFRMQAGLPGSSPTGLISADVTTITRDGLLGGSNAIEIITAGMGIAGKVEAISPTFDPASPSVHQATIGKVVVGPSTSSSVVGMTGDIIADNGRIGSIFSTGPIGSATTSVTITAANGIGEIRTIAESDPGTVFARDVFATVTAHQAILDDPENFPYNQPSSDGPLELLEVGGDLHGEIRAANILGSNNSGDRRGIIVRGICYAPITIEFVVDHANILAQTFVEPIRVGRTVRGAIVATGGATTPSEPPPGYADGHIPSIIIGDLDDSEVPAAVLTNYFPNIRGLGGIFGVRTDIPDGEAWFTATPVSGTALDSCVRAQHSIGEAFIASLTIQQFAQPNTFGCQKFSPVVEAPVIGSIIIQDLAAGTVWSGQYDEMDPASEYAAIGEILIGCVGRQGTIRATGWSSFVVEHNVFGDIHVPTVPEGSLIQIGGILGDDQDAIYEGDLEDELCRCSVHTAPGCEDCVRTSNYYSFENNHVLGGFRNPNAPYFGGCTTAAPDNRGQIWVHENEGLHGQIIINASNTGLPQAALWTGAVQVGETTGGCPLLEISPTFSSAEWESPHYHGLSAALGGGAVGLVPYHLHDLDCLPRNGPTTPVFLNSAFCHIPPSVPDAYEFEEIVLSFYGPVYADVEAAFPVRVRHVDSPGGTEYAAMMDVTFDQGQGGTLSRFITLHGDGSTLIPAGTYVIRPILDIDPQTGEPTSDALRCDGLLTADEVLVGEDFSYTFVLVSDCNLNGQEDTEEIAQNLMLDVWPMNGIIDSCVPDACVLDYNDDGNVDQDDIDCLSCLVAGGPCPDCHPYADPDFNNDGNVDQQDIADLANAIASGCP